MSELLTSPIISIEEPEPTKVNLPKEPVDVNEPLTFVEETFSKATSSSLISTPPPSAFSSIFPATSMVRLPELKSISVPSMVILSIVTPPSASKLVAEVTPKVVAPNVD